MRILFVIRDPPGFGGAERRLLEMGKRLAARGHQVIVLCGKTGPNMPDEEDIDGVRLHYIRLLPENMFRFKRISFYLSRYLFYFLSFFWGRRISQINPDIIIEYVTPSPSMVYLLARRQRIPIVAEIMEYRGLELWLDAADPISARLGYISQHIFFRFFRYLRIITISQATKSQLEAGGLRTRKIHVIPPGINLRDYQPAGNVARTPGEILVVGRLMPQKGHRYLLEALPEVAQKCPEIHLTVVGDGPLREELELQAVDLGIADLVTFTGVVSETEKVAHLWRAELFVMPSTQEGFGMVLLEAMACGLPIAAFDLPVFHEILGESSGRFAPVRDTSALAAHIVDLLKDDLLREKMSAFNREYVKMFGWEDAVDALEGVLNEVLREVSRSSKQLNSGPHPVGAVRYKRLSKIKVPRIKSSTG